MRWFIGTNFGHGAAAAAISEEGELLYAVEEGRLIGQKETNGFPVSALSWILEHSNTREVVWAEGWNPWKRLCYKGVASALRFGTGDTDYYGGLLAREWSRSLSCLVHIASWRSRLGRVHSCGHHRAHAFSLLPAGLPSDSLVLVSDTTAERESVSLFHWSGRSMALLACSPFPHSIGRAFHRCARHLGFRGRTAPGKLMALSAYGEPRWGEILRQIATVRGGTPRFDLKLLPLWHSTEAWSRFGASQSNRELRLEIERSRDHHEEGLHLAASVQEWFTEVTWACIEQGVELAHRRFGAVPVNLGLAGGCALNCRANGSLVRSAGRLGLRSVTISPWSDDSGTAIGAAAWAFANSNDPERLSVTGPFLGPPACQPTQRSDDAISVKAAVDALMEGGVIALASGNLEFGPRALGGRCLLADPRRPEMRTAVNLMKGRPPFMPVAPVVLAEDESTYFRDSGSPWMTYTVEACARARERIPACVHHDGSARVQMLRRDDAQMLRRLLLHFKERSGESALILTSLNGAGEAIPTSLDAAESVSRRLGAWGILSDRGWQRFQPPA
jgi:carbamoyltransferase